MTEIEKLLIQIALSEDIGTGDVSSDLIDANLMGEAIIKVNENAVLCGQPYVNEIIKKSTLTIQWFYEDGSNIKAGSTIAKLRGRLQEILNYERVMLNFLQTLSGTATVVRKVLQIFNNTKTNLLDTRKTIPGLRLGQKYAVRIGGGTNHRLGLYDRYLIKENHIKACGGITNAVSKAQKQNKHLILEVEVENLTEFDEVLGLEIDIIMLDNFSYSDIKQATKQLPVNSKTKLEVSGNIDINDNYSLQKLVDLKVDYISVGAITKHLQAIDFSMRIS